MLWNKSLNTTENKQTKNTEWIGIYQITVNKTEPIRFGLELIKRQEDPWKRIRLASLSEERTLSCLAAALLSQKNPWMIINPTGNCVKHACLQLWAENTHIAFQGSTDSPRLRREQQQLNTSIENVI